MSLVLPWVVTLVLPPTVGGINRVVCVPHGHVRLGHRLRVKVQFVLPL